MRYDNTTSGTPQEAASLPEEATQGAARLVQLAQADDDAETEAQTDQIEEPGEQDTLAENTEEEVVRMVILAEEGEVVVLPEGTSLDEIEIRDDDKVTTTAAVGALPPLISALTVCCISEFLVLPGRRSIL